MAAGMGSRYGGLKQIDPVGPSGEIILDYSAYDALRAGFEKIVFVIRRDLEELFREKVGRNLERRTDVAYVFQDISMVPEGFSVPEGRVKPWGTGHAVMVCKGAIDTPFAAINADDYYGSSAFQTIADYLRTAKDRNGLYDYCMVGYAIGNTVSEHGSVARGICEVTDGLLTDLRERTRIEQFPDGIRYTENGSDWVDLPPDSVASMNFWGLTPSFLDELEAGFPEFLCKSADDPLKAEYFLPEAVGDLAKAGKARVRVLPTDEKWFGVTYQEDRPLIQNAMRSLIRTGVYPEKLWE